jgi:DNA-binding transcriptional MerR regulator
VPARARSARSTPPEGGPDGGYTIDDLAARSGVPSRTIRFYQAKHLLAAPRRRGRGGVYDETHLERLELIGRLQDRGLSLRVIRDLLERGAAPGLSIDDWLGLSEELGAPWSEDQPRWIEKKELEQLLGKRPSGTLGSLLRIGAVEREEGGGQRFRVPSSGLLHVALRLLDAGIDLETAGRMADIVRRHLTAAVAELLASLSERAGRGFGRRGTAADLGGAIEGLRPVAADAVRLIFAQELERELQDFLRRGGRASPRKTRRR